MCGCYYVYIVECIHQSRSIYYMYIVKRKTMSAVALHPHPLRNIQCPESCRNSTNLIHRNTFSTRLSLAAPHNQHSDMPPTTAPQHPFFACRLPTRRNHKQSNLMHTMSNVCGGDGDGKNKRRAPTDWHINNRFGC